MSKMLAADKKRLKELHDKVHGVVYMATCSATGKKYVGKTTRPIDVRVRGHYTEARCKNTTSLHAAINEYGEESFSWEVLAPADNSKMLSFMEKHFIRLHATIAPHGYNMNQGGAGPDSHTDETKLMISAALTGIKRSEETRRKISESSKGRALSPETRRKLRDINTGKRHSDETKEKCRIASLGRTHSEESKAKMRRVQKDLADAKCREIVIDGVKYSSMTSASNETGICQATMRKHGAVDGGTLSLDSSCLSRGGKAVMRPVILDGVEYESISAAARSADMRMGTLWLWISRGDKRARYV